MLLERYSRVVVSVPKVLPRPFSHFAVTWRKWITSVNGTDVLLKSKTQLAAIPGWQVTTTEPAAFIPSHVLPWVPLDWLGVVERQGRLFT